MTFTLNLVETPDLERVDVNGFRHYRVGNELYPSVTSVLSADEGKEQGLQVWRDRVGPEEASRVSRHAAYQGGAAHTLVEDHILGHSRTIKIAPHIRAHAKRLCVVADRYIDDIRIVEGRMSSDVLRVAGTADLIAHFDGVLSVIDWKTSRRKKKRDWITGYFIQESAYAQMFYELTGIRVHQLVTVVSTDCGNTQVFKVNTSRWLPEFVKLRKKFYESHKS